MGSKLQMSLFESIGLDIGYVLIGTIIVILILLIFILILFAKQKKILQKYEKFMQGANGESLESAVEEKFTAIAQLKEESQAAHEELNKINEILMGTYQKLGMVKYDAFKEMGGKLSFVLVLLNNKNTGFLINSMHSSREGCYTYVKEIINGEAFVLLSDEEKQALDIAINSQDII